MITHHNQGRTKRPSYDEIAEESDTRRDVRIDKSAIRASCDTAAEAVAMMEVSRVAMDALASVRMLVEARLASLAGNDIAGSPDLRLLSFDDHDEWIDAESGKTVLSLPLTERFR